MSRFFKKGDSSSLKFKMMSSSLETTYFDWLRKSRALSRLSINHHDLYLLRVKYNYLNTKQDLKNLWLQEIILKVLEHPTTKQKNNLMSASNSLPARMAWHTVTISCHRSDCTDELCGGWAEDGAIYQYYHAQEQDNHYRNGSLGSFRSIDNADEVIEARRPCSCVLIRTELKHIITIGFRGKISHDIYR